MQHPGPRPSAQGSAKAVEQAAASGGFAQERGRPRRVNSIAPGTSIRYRPRGGPAPGRVREGREGRPGGDGGSRQGRGGGRPVRTLNPAMLPREVASPRRSCWRRRRAVLQPSRGRLIAGPRSNCQNVSPAPRAHPLIRVTRTTVPPSAARLRARTAKIGDERRERVKLTINNAFDEKQRERSLASLKRKREREEAEPWVSLRPEEKITREVICSRGHHHRRTGEPHDRACRRRHQVSDEARRDA